MFCLGLPLTSSASAICFHILLLVGSHILQAKLGIINFEDPNTLCLLHTLVLYCNNGRLSSPMSSLCLHSSHCLNHSLGLSHASFSGVVFSSLLWKYIGTPAVIKAQQKKTAPVGSIQMPGQIFCIQA